MATTTEKRIVCFGDSVTEALPYCAPGDTFVELLARRLSYRYAGEATIRAWNCGVGGENTAEGLARIERDVIVHQPHLVTVEFGLNDIRYEPEKRILEPQFAANLREMHARLTAQGAQVVFMTPNPIIDSCHPYSQGTNYYQPWGGCNALGAIYAQIIREVAAELGTPLCDIHETFVKKAIELEYLGGTSDWRDLSVLRGYINEKDGVHPTTVGQNLMARELYALIVRSNLLGL